MTDIEITLADLEDTRHTLNACLSFFTARDLLNAQSQMRDFRASPLTDEVERLKSRFDGYLADYLLALHEDEEDEALEDEDEEEEAPVVEEILADLPLGGGNLPRQQGRRLSREEIAAVNEAEDPAEGFA